MIYVGIIKFFFRNEILFFKTETKECCQKIVQ